MSLPEHSLHVGDLCHLPFGQVLVERFGITEHVTHVHDEFVNVPLGHVPVEGVRLTERRDHAGDFVHVPLGQCPAWKIWHQRTSRSCW